MANRKQP